MTAASGRVLAFDWGLGNIGVAVGNRLTGTSEPLTRIRAQNGAPRWEQIEALLREWQPEQVLVGDPLNMDGSESDMCARARRFARRLEGRFAIPVTMVDERLTSHAAKADARERGHDGDYGSNPIDAEAANLILQDWLTSQT